MVFPLTALFFGTGNQTPHVSAAVIGRVFLDDDLKLFEYCPKRLLNACPEMFAFSRLESIFESMRESLGPKVKVYTDRKVTKVERGLRGEEGSVRVSTAGGHVGRFDEVVFACDAETVSIPLLSVQLISCASRRCVDFVRRLRHTQKPPFRVVIWSFSPQILKVLEEPRWIERRALGNVRYYNDCIVTHEDEAYMKERYHLMGSDDDMYFVRTDPTDRELIEMSFNLSAYQPHLADAHGRKRRVFQSIFLDDSGKDKWTVEAIDKSKVGDRVAVRLAERIGLALAFPAAFYVAFTKPFRVRNTLPFPCPPKQILKTRWTRQFAHTWTHFAFWVPFVRFLQGHRSTWYCGAYTLFNTHEIGTMSGLAVADRLGAPYPFAHDPLALKQFEQFMSIVHG